MKNNKPLLLTFGLSTLVIALAIGFNMVHQDYSKLQADEPNYEFYLNNNKRISNDTQVYTNEKDAYMETNLGNQIDLKVSNVIKYNDGWQTINSHGYFYNPVSELGNNNKISGIKSIKYTSDSSNELSLYYGWSINNTEIIYSLKEKLTAGVEYTFNESKPSYFYIENDSESSININSLSIKYSCSEDPYPYQDMNVLMIGNSFADDTIYYAARIAQSYGINLNIFDSYIASCTIDKHYNNLLNDTASYSMRTMNGDNWVYADNRNLGQIVDFKKWDIITFQQASAQVGRNDSYSNLTNLVNAVKNRLDYTPRLMWNLTWAYDYSYQEYYDYFSYFNNDQIAMYNAIISCYQSEVAPLGLFERIIPAGTAVQNMRSSYMGDTISRDGKHMSTVHGRFLLGLDLLSSIYGIDLYKSPCTYKPFDINQSYINTATECAYNAVKTPLQITNSQYISHEIASYDLSNYTEIDAGLVGCSYWDATDASNYNKRLQNNSGISNKYVSTNRFTSSTLPVGSIIAIDEAFGVSLQTWTSDSQQTGTMQEIYDNVITIDNNFWNGYAFRAFNIFKASKSILSGQYVDQQYSQVFDGFHIYVPNASLGNLKTKTQNDSYESDKTIFTSRYYNIDAFERIHLDPIIGFYKCDSYYYLMNSYVDDTAQKFVCTRPFYSRNNDLPENTIIILDDGYQYRSDCWTSHGTTSRPGNVTSQFTVLGPSFWSNYRTRTFNVSAISSTKVGQNAIAYMNHMRIYVPVSDDIYIEREDTATMTAFGYATLNSTGAAFYGKSDIPVQVTLHGDDVNKVRVLADGVDMNATRYSFNKSTNQITISTSGTLSALELALGNITGTINKDAGTITGVSISGSMKSYVSNNGSISLNEMYFDRCNYSTNAASQVNWQRWYMNNSTWTANAGTGDWTTSERTYLLDNDYSMGLRIAPNNYQKTRFTLKTDFNNGNGITPHGIGIWLYNPNSTIGRFRIYVYTAASSIVGDHASPNANYSNQIIEKQPLESNQWFYVGTGINVGKIYNISLYFESSSSATTFVYLGHLSIY